MAAPTRRRQLLVGPSQRLVRAGLAGLWLFDEGSGTVIRDRSGQGNDLTLQNNPAWISAGVSFTIASSHHATSPHLLGDGTGNSLMVVFRAASLGSNRSVCGVQLASSNRAYIGTASASNEIAGAVGTQTNATIKGTTVLAINTWYLATLAWGVTTGDAVQLWLGKTLEYAGVQAGTNDATFGLVVGGRNNAGTAGNLWAGSVAAVLSYRGRLTQTQVEQNYRVLGQLLLRRNIVLA